MKVVQMNCVYESGSTGKIVAAIHHHLSECGDESFVIYGMGAKRENSSLIRTTPKLVRKVQSFWSRITGYPYGGCVWGTAVALRALKRLKPDVVHLHCVNGYMVNIYRILEFLKKNGIPTVLTNHAEFMYTGGCTHSVDCDKWMTGCHDCNRISKEHPISYFFDRTKREWELLRKAYDGFDKLIICCVSDWVRDRARLSPFFKGCQVITVLNGLDAGVFRYRDASGLRAQLKLKGKKVVIHVTPNFGDPIKGGRHVIEMARRFPDAEFLILGSDAKDGAVPQNCRFMGKITDQMLLAQYYSLGDVCLLTSVRETFSMVCAESLCCGTPVVGFCAGGPETISLPEFSTFVDQGDDDGLERALGEMLGKNCDKECLSAIAVKTYGQETMCGNYNDIYHRLFNQRGFHEQDC